MNKDLHMLFVEKKMKRTSNGSSDQPAKKSKHGEEYDVRWKEEFPWHVPVYSKEGNTESDMTGLLCSVCQSQNNVTMRALGQTTKIATYLRKDMLQ